MEQVFDLVNHVLRRDRETRRRNLNIRGYKVIPLTSQAGLIEFVLNTSALKDFLQPAHERCAFCVCARERLTQQLRLGTDLKISSLKISGGNLRLCIK